MGVVREVVEAAEKFEKRIEPIIHDVMDNQMERSDQERMREAEERQRRITEEHLRNQ